jgi:hypothetical protein
VCGWCYAGPVASCRRLMRASSPFIHSS